MKKSLLIALSLTALCANVSTLPAWADAPSATSAGSPRIQESQLAAPSFDPELEKLHKAGLSAQEKKDYAKAVKYYRQAAERGYAKSQFLLASCYAVGKGVAKDPVQAVYWLRKAAEQGYADAQYGLGVCYDEGEGVARDPVKSVYWQRKAAEQGVADAQFNLGLCYATGDGVAQNLTQAFHWFRKAAEQGVTDAQLNLGSYYYNGKGVAKNPSQAVYWFRKAAEKGDAKAQLNLGICYANGEGVAKDPAQATKWFRKAAEQGYAKAQLNLGCFYCSESTNAKTNIAEGKKWLQKVAAHQDEDSQELAAMAKDILKEINDIETAIAKVKECKQLAQSFLRNNTIEDKELVDSLNNVISLAGESVAELFNDLHETPELIVEAHIQNQEAAQKLNRRRQSRQTALKPIVNLIEQLKAYN